LAQVEPADVAAERARVGGGSELRQGLQALSQSLALDLRPAALEALIQYADQLSHWGRVFNLTALRDPHAVLEGHLLDCLAALPAVDRMLGFSAPAAGGSPSPAPDGVGVARCPGQGESARVPQSAGPLRVLDVGSGGGLPGAVWAIARPAWSITCLDAVAKKAAFVRQVAAELSLPSLSAVHARVEAWRPTRPLPPDFHLVTSRAFASLADFCAGTRHLLAPGGVWVAMKGRRPDDEIRALPSDVDVFHVEPLVLPGLDLQRCLVWMRLRQPAGGEGANPIADAVH
jgi:16S rRNA (guanine527-N7)-methyltransferase